MKVVGKFDDGFHGCRYICCNGFKFSDNRYGPHFLRIYKLYSIIISHVYLYMDTMHVTYVYYMTAFKDINPF